MRAFLQHLGVSLKLHYRNKMALIYGYLFPLIFLIAFWVVYRYDSVPLIRHMPALFKQLVETFALEPQRTSKYRLGIITLGESTSLTHA